MTLEEINGLASAIKIATEKGFWEQASFIAVVISAAISAAALWFIRAQMKGGNDQLEILAKQVSAMQTANETSTEQLKIVSRQLQAMQDTNVAVHGQLVIAEDRASKELGLNTINLMFTWEQRLQFQTQQVARLVEKLDREQCHRLENGKEFYVSEELSDLVELCMPEQLFPVEKTSKGIRIAGKMLVHLRFTVVSYLNLIESILTAWHQNIIDRTVIEDQFSFLRHGGENILQNYRVISGIDYYPSIAKFLKRLEQIEDSRLPQVKGKSPS